jgi:hypothetical protein
VDAVERLIAYFQTLTPDRVLQLRRHYADDAYFKDPFNEVRTRAEIEVIFSRMFHQMEAPRFAVRGKVVQGAEAFLIWDLEFRFRGRAREERIHGVTHLRFGADGRVVYHRDYWDAAEELYSKIPVLGALMRWLKRRIA